MKAHNRIQNRSDFDSTFKGIKLDNLSKKKNPFSLNKEIDFLPDLDLDDDQEDFIAVKPLEMDEDEDEDYGKEDDLVRPKLLNYVGLDEEPESQESIMKKNDLTGGETPSAPTPIAKVE